VPEIAGKGPTSGRYRKKEAIFPTPWILAIGWCRPYQVIILFFKALS